MKLVEKVAKYFALKNAIEHGGVASKKSVIGMVLAFDHAFKRNMKNVLDIVAKVVDEINSIDIEKQKEEFKRTEKFELKKEEKKKELPNVSDSFVVRFAPNPDGVLHIGSARPAILNYYYAKRYNGKFILRFDDTDPKIKTPEKWFYEQIEKDLKWLGIKWNEKYYASKRLDVYKEYAKKLIEMGNAYVCLCKEEWKKFKHKREACPCRGLNEKEHFKRWKKMEKWEYKEGEAVLRIKTNIKSKKCETIDWPAFRIVDNPKHPFSKSHLWPLYNFASAIDDHLFGVTHIMRGQEHKTNEAKQQFIYKYFGWKYPISITLGRFGLRDSELSKSKIRDGINFGNYIGWDDPRLGTIMALRRRGFRPEAIKRLVMDIGVKPNDIILSLDNLSAYNRKILDPITKRLFFVPDPVEIEVANTKEKEIHVPYHPEKKDEKRVIKVSKKIFVSKTDFKKFCSKPVRLKDWCNIILGKKAKVVDDTLKVPKIQWAPKIFSKKAKVVIPGYVINGMVEKNIENFKLDDSIQFERFGFVRLDCKKPLVFYFTHR